MPKPGIKTSDFRVLNFINQIKTSEVLVDGVRVKNEKNNIFGFEHSCLKYNGVINFTGEEKPELSVDRNTITDVSQKLKEKLDKLPKEVAKTIINKLKEHFKKYEFDSFSKEIKMIWEYLLDRFNTEISVLLIKYLVNVDEVDMFAEDLSNLMETDMTIKNLISLENITIKKFNLKKLNITSKLILVGKLIDAKQIKVNDSRVDLESKKFSIIVPKNHFSGEPNISIAVKADVWKGEYEQYDLVSSLWPIIPQRLYDKLDYDREVEEINSRAKYTASYGNSLYGITKLEPTLIHPKSGIYKDNRPSSEKDKDENLVGKYGKPYNIFWMSEINNGGRICEEKGEDYFVYAYIAPRELNSREIEKLEKDYKEQEPDYYQGVKEGWSILFLGRTGETVILPGIREKEEHLEKIKDSFWEKYNDINFYFLDETCIN